MTLSFAQASVHLHRRRRIIVLVHQVAVRTTSSAWDAASSLGLRYLTTSVRHHVWRSAAKNLVGCDASACSSSEDISVKQLCARASSCGCVYTQCTSELQSEVKRRRLTPTRRLSAIDHRFHLGSFLPRLSSKEEKLMKCLRTSACAIAHMSSCVM